MLKRLSARTTSRVVSRALSFAATIILLGGSSSYAAQVVYKYDDSGRLKTVIYPNNMTKDYTLDAAGNRTQVQTQPMVDMTRPSSPGAISFSSVTATSFTVNWGAATDNLVVTGYEYQVNGNVWQLLGNVLTVNLTGLTPSTTYAVQVRARDAAGNTSSLPSSNSTTTLAPVAVPDAPSWTTYTQCAAVGICTIETDLQYAWTTMPRAASYELEIARLDSGNFPIMGAYGLLYSGATAAYLEPIWARPEFAEHVRVRACNSSGCSAYSSMLEIARYVVWGP